MTAIEESQSRRKRGKGGLDFLTINGRQVYRAVQNSTYTASDGTKKRRRVTGIGETPEEAQRALGRNLDRQESGIRKPYEKRSPEKLLTFSELFDEWFMQIDRDAVSDIVLQKYQRAGALHLKPHIGERVASELRKQDFIALINTTLYEKTKANGEPLLTSGSRLNISKLLTQVLKYGVSIGVWNIQPLDGWKRPSSVKKEDPNISKITGMAISLLTKMSREHHPDFARFSLQWLGLRRAERLGLTYDCVIGLDSKNPRIKIKQQLARYADGSGWYIKPDPKTQAGNREIPLVEPFLTAMREHKSRQDDLKKSANWEPEAQFANLVFLKENGGVITLNRDNDDWNNLLKSYLGEEYEADKWRGHLNRHITATMLGNASPPIPLKYVKSILGHSEEAMSLYYIAVDKESMREAMTEYGKQFGKRIMDKET